MILYNIIGLTKAVGHGDNFQIGKLDVRVYHTPCHTKGHVVFLVSDLDDSTAAPILFCGDTLFIGKYMFLLVATCTTLTT